MNKKIIFTDVDGTWLSFTGDILPLALAACKALKQNGHRKACVYSYTPLHPDIVAREFEDALQMIRHYDEALGGANGPNDAEMLQICGTGIAMGGAPESLKAMADLVTGELEQDGFANAFKHLGLI